MMKIQCTKLQNFLQFLLRNAPPLTLCATAAFLGGGGGGFINEGAWGVKWEDNNPSEMRCHFAIGNPASH